VLGVGHTLCHYGPRSSALENLAGKLLLSWGCRGVSFPGGRGGRWDNALACTAAGPQSSGRKASRARRALRFGLLPPAQGRPQTPGLASPVFLGPEDPCRRQRKCRELILMYREQST